MTHTNKHRAVQRLVFVEFFWIACLPNRCPNFHYILDLSEFDFHCARFTTLPDGASFTLVLVIADFSLRSYKGLCIKFSEFPNSHPWFLLLKTWFAVVCSGCRGLLKKAWLFLSLPMQCVFHHWLNISLCCVFEHYQFILVTCFGAHVTNFSPFLKSPCRMHIRNQKQLVCNFKTPL